MDEIKIETNVPVPFENRGCNRGKYPWAKMMVGSSFFSKGSTAQNLRAVSLSWKKTHNPDWKFSACVEGEGENRGARIWRVK